MDARAMVRSLTSGKVLICLMLLQSLVLTVRCSEDLQPCVGSGSGSESSGLDPQSSGIDPFACATDTITTVTANTVSRGIEGGQNSPSISMSSSVGTMSTSGAVTSLPVVASTETRSVATSVGTPPSVTALRSTETTVLPTPSPMPQPQPSITTSPSVATSMQTMSVTSTTDHTAPDQISTTESPSLSILDRIRLFFEQLDQDSRIGIYVGAGVVVLLLIVVCLLCCVCICSRVKRKRRKGKMDLTEHRKSLTISNPIAMVSSSHQHNGVAPARYRSTIHDSSEYSDSYNIQDLDHEPFNFPSSEYHETSIDDVERTYKPSQVGHTTQPSQMTQMSTATDLFRERSLPKLSPLSYSSQLLTAPQFPNHYTSLSVDENDPHPAIGSRRSSLLALIPNTSPSLRKPTPMALSLKNEESKSAQGSKISVHGSRTSMQGSRPSMLGSRGSVQMGTGSRSQIYSSTLSSREHSSLLLSGAREFGGAEDDAVSLPLSGRGTSPAMNQNSLEEVPTRDSPVPDIASHAVGYGKKDFASLTCIPNQYAAEAERLEVKKQLSTVPEKHTTESEGDVGKESPTETKKKPRSRAMSKLEKLTSLDYIRASLRLKKKKRVSFVKTPESVPNDKQKNSKSDSNSKSQSEQASTGDAANPPKDLLQSRRHSASGRAEFSPLTKAPPTPHKFPDHYYYPQLSQPMYYGGGATVMHPAMFYQYPQLSQQYYAQLSQGGYGGPAHPPHMVYPNSMMDSYGRSYGEPPTTRYDNMVTPELFDETPDPDFYNERSPRNVLESKQDHFEPPERSNVPPSSPDRFTETSDSSSYLMQPPSASHLHDDPLTSAHRHFMNEFVMDSDHYGYGGEHHHVPTYPGDMMGRGQVIPEAYREVYQPMDPTTSPTAHGHGHEYDTRHHVTGQQYAQYPGFAGVTYSAPRRTSRSSYASSTSDHAPLNDVRADYDQSINYQENGESAVPNNSTKTRVSWSTEVIEYQRTPSDLADSDFDFNQF